MRPMPLQAISLLFHAYVGWRLVPALGSFAAGAVLRAAARRLGADAAVRPRRAAAAARAARRPARLDRPGLHGPVLVAVRADAACATSALLAAVALDALRPGTLASAPLIEPSARAVVHRRRRWSRSGASSTRAAPRRCVRVDVPIAGLPPALHGFTIAQISDVHVGPTIKRAYLEAHRRRRQRARRRHGRHHRRPGRRLGARPRRRTSRRSPACARATAPSSSPATTSTTRAPTPGSRELRRLGLHVLMNEHVVAPARRRGAGRRRRHRLQRRTISTRPSAATRAPRSPARRRRGAASAARAPAAQRRGRRGAPASTCSSPATPTAASSCPGTSSSACSSRSPPGCTAGAGCGSTPAAAPATGGRRSASARRRRSPCCAWSARPSPAPATVPAVPRAATVAPGV